MKYVALLIPALAFSAVDGTVANRTTGKPQANATVTLFKLGGAGPEALESVKTGADGRFRIAHDPVPQTPYLIETAWDGVTYNHMLPPGTPHHELQLEVFDSARKPDAARPNQRIVFLEPGERLSVSEAWLFRNDSKLAYNDPDGGTFRFFLPEAAGGKVTVMATAPQGLPIARAAEKTGRAGLYKVDFPIKPGESRIDVSYTLPPGAFSGKSAYKDVLTRLVVPGGVTLEGAGLASLGQDPHMRAEIYETKGAEIAVQIKGTGSLRTAAPAEEEAGPSIQQILPRIYDKLAWILVPAFLVLLFGFLLLYRMAPVRRS